MLYCRESLAQVYIANESGHLQKKTPAEFYNRGARMSTSTVAAGQDPTNLFPPSPTAAALVKYRDIPVGYHTGTPNISILIYEVKSKELSLPISLSYHASGNKVADVASWVGLGWSLNAGGAITRTVQSLPDKGVGVAEAVICLIPPKAKYLLGDVSLKINKLLCIEYKS